MARQRREAADYGPELRLSRGDVMIEGQAVPRGRALSIVDELGPELRGAVALVLRLFEAAQLNGFACSDFQRTSCGSAGARDAPCERAEAARRQLAAIERRIGPLMWSTIVDLLLWGKSAEAWAFECRGRGYRLDRKAARPALTCALDAVAAMRERPRA